MASWCRVRCLNQGIVHEGALCAVFLSSPGGVRNATHKMHSAPGFPLLLVSPAARIMLRPSPSLEVA